MIEKQMHQSEGEKSTGSQSALEQLALLAGEWTGRGRGSYPTIESFEYIETLRIRHEPGSAYLTYEQRTEIIDSDGRPIRRSHWEAGLIRPKEDGSVELVCVQSSGRVEILRGSLEGLDSPPGEFSLSFESEIIENDGRALHSSRVWRLAGSQLDYEMSMQTTNVGELTFHVGSQLAK